MSVNYLSPSGIPASLSYSDWIRVAAALKNEGESFETFDRWSQTAPEKYDAATTKKTWDSVGGEDHPEITGKTLCFLQKKYGKPFLPTPPAMLPRPQSDEDLKAQAEILLTALFSEDETVELVLPRSDNPKVPQRPGFIGKWPEALKKLQSTCVEQGAWCGLNPLKETFAGRAPGDQDVSDYRYTLVEADEGTLDEQWQAIVTLQVIPPIQAAIWSGGKSLHFIVRVEAHDQKQYQERVKVLHEYLKSKGVIVDAATKNASRLTRLPGVRRGADMQYLIAAPFGAPDWTTFAAHIQSPSGNVPDRRAVSSPINGQKGGRPPLDTALLSRQYISQLENQQERLIFWDGKFYLYHASRWVLLDAQELQARLSKFLQDMLPPGERVGRQTVTDLLECLKGTYISNLDCPEQPYLIEEKKCIPDYMIFANGAVSIEELKSKPLSECKVIPKSSNLFGQDDTDYDFDPNAQCPEWEKAVNEWLPDEEDRKMLQRIFGYIISRSTRLNVCFIWFGPSGCGKSQPLDVLRKLMGESRCSSVPLAALYSRFNTARLATSYLNTQEELPAGGATRGQNGVESLLKTATDGGTIQIEHKGIDPKDGKIKARFVFCTNTLPVFNDPSNGLWDRLVILPFEQKIRFTDKQVDEFAEKVLFPEASGIFNWAVQGMRELQECKRFPVTTKSAKLLANLHKRCNLESSFVQEYFSISMGNALPLEAIMRAYDEYVKTYNGIPKTRDAVKAALLTAFPFVEFKRCRMMYRQLPAVVNLTWLGEDETPDFAKLQLNKEDENEVEEPKQTEDVSEDPDTETPSLF